MEKTVREISVTGEGAPEPPAFTLSAQKCLINTRIEVTFEEGFEGYHIRVRRHEPREDGFTWIYSENRGEVLISGAGANEVCVQGEKNGLWSDWSEPVTVTAQSNGKMNTPQKLSRLK